MKLKQLTESPTLADEVEAEKEKNQSKQGIDNAIDGDDGQIERALNDAFSAAKRQFRLPESEREWPAILFVGEPGSGKTSRIKAWARNHGINLYGVQASTMDEVDLNGPVVMDTDESGKKFATRLASVEFDKLNRPNSVLFLDEFNRARGGVRGTLLTLINDHMVPDAREPGGMRLLKNMLFTVAAINPEDTNLDVDELGQAEKDRFRHIRIVSDKNHWLRYILKRSADLVKGALEDGDKQAAFEEQRRAALIKALVTNTGFDFDDSTSLAKDRDNRAWNGLTLNNRNLTKLLDACDGTKDDFLDKWNEYTNNLRKPMVDRILKNYVDVDDKANDALNFDTQSGVFGKAKKSSLDKIMDYLDGVED